jgi:hypothetical protein
MAEPYTPAEARAILEAQATQRRAKQTAIQNLLENYRMRLQSMVLDRTSIFHAIPRGYAPYDPYRPR